MLDAFRTQPVAMMLTASGIAMLLFGGGLLLYERFSSASRRYFLFSSSVSFWLLGSGTGLRAAGDPTPWLRLAYAADALVGPALYWLVLLLTGVRRPLASRTAWAAGLALMLVSLSSDVVADGVRSLSPGTPLGGSALVAVLLFLLLAACVLVSVRELLLAYRRARVPEDRHRHGLMLAAFAVSSLGFLDLVLPWLGLPVLMMSPLAITGGLVVTGIAASRYRLLSGVPLFATREVVRTMSDAVVVVDTDGRIRSANPAAARLSERRPSALRGMHVMDLLLDPEHPAPDDLEEATAAVLAGWRDREMLLLRTADEPVAVSVSAEQLREGPRVSGAVVVARDIRDRLRAEEAVLASDLRYRSLFWHNPGLAYEFTPDGTLLGTNPALERLFDLEPAELIGTSIWEIIAAEDRQVSREALSRVLEGEPQSYEISLHTGIGKRIIRGVSIPVFSDGVVTSVFGVAQDITDEAEAKHELEVQRRYFAELFESSPEAIVLVDHTGMIRRVNQEFCALFGYEESELLGQEIDGLIVPEGREEEARNLTAEATGGGRAQAETVRRRRDGGTVEVSVLAREVQLPGEPPQMYGIYRDISERLATERKLRESERDLRRAQKLEAVGKLAGGVAHDFNNLLTVINGNARIILDSLGPGDALRADLEEIERAGMRAAGLTQQLLAFSRRQMMQPRPMDLNAAITGMTRMLDRLTGDAVELRVCLDASLATIMADPAQLEQVVVNLTVNAREAMPDGGILTISTDNTEIAPEEPRIAGYGLGPGRYVRLMVEDSGAGMSPETLARVFDPFFSTKEQAPGTGLGLATVFGIIKQSGGHITAETQRDAGSRFVAYLPVAEQTAETGEPTVQDAPEDEGLGTVLLAEDEEAVRRLTARVLQRHGYTVLAAENGTAALEVFRRDPAGVDLVLSDLVMPGMGGRDLVRAIHELRPSMPIIFMSGYEEEMARSGAQERAAQFLAKPFSPRDLVATVAAVFREHVRT